ncbi:hypothetical protein JCGZ_00092 [Jatropha curcas]|uniref:Aminotransferase-like plant mobile domain-containing protein n=1 Tax=Jatropha curcas TaxID=180498 RepID=A0A067LG80_JATCU|nr:hypothetical protein JCGZ_00092 [Jatropha curcas]
MAFRNQVSSFVQSIPDDLWQVPPMNQLVWLKYFKDLKPDYGFLSWLVTHFNPKTMVFRFEVSEVTPTYEEMCAVMDHHPDQDETPALPPGPRDIALHITNFNVHHRGCPLLLQAWALDKLSLIPPVPAHLILTYGPASFRSRTRGHLDFGDNSTIRWTCPWWRISLVTTGSMNLNYVLYASLDRSMAYFPDRISRQYGMIQHVPRIHNFESGLITPHLLTNLADRWQNRNSMYLDEGTV